MSRLGRPQNVVPPIEWSISLPSDLAAQVELLLLDPMRGKPKVGARSKLIEQLRRGWIEERKKEILSQLEAVERGG